MRKNGKLFLKNKDGTRILFFKRAETEELFEE
jgi:hypothetical protein